MAKSRPVLICWDSAVFISQIKGNEGEERNRAVASIMDVVKGKGYRLLASVLVYTEVLGVEIDTEGIGKFYSLINNSGIIDILDVDIRVAQKAGEIRSKSNIKTPDAIHIATAIIGGAKCFHTFDKRLLNLDGQDAVEGLAVTACELPGANPPPF